MRTLILILLLILLLCSCHHVDDADIVIDSVRVSVPLPADPDEGGGPQDPDSWTPSNEPPPPDPPPGDPPINDPDNPNDDE